MIKHKEQKGLVEDIDTSCVVIHYLEKNNVLSLLIDGKVYTYVVLINLSKTDLDAYADVSFYRKYGVIDDVVNEVFSGIDYLVCDGKVFITGFATKDCIIVKKVKIRDEGKKYAAT